MSTTQRPLYGFDRLTLGLFAALVFIGWLMIFWAAPTMTVAHLVFAVMTTAYILVAIQLEERDLVDAFGQTYVDYRRRTPMLIPRLGAARRDPASANRETRTSNAGRL